MARFGPVIVAACLAGVLAGCGTTADGGRSFGNGELVNDVATRLTTSGATAYTAVFSVHDNATVSIAHTAAPDQTAYRYPGGMVLLTPADSTVCTTSAKSSTCTAAASPVSPDIDAAIEHGGLVRPETVASMLTQAAQDPDVVVSEQDRTIAGTTATCLAIGGAGSADAFSACVTTDGLLASFSGTVSTNALDLSLDHYTLGVASTAFALPPGAKTRH